jgi:hypothetical protein
VQWLTSEGQIFQAGKLIGSADRIRMLHPQLHAEMFSELRWSREEAATRRDGIDVETLSLSIADQAGLRICSHWPTLDLIRQWDLGRRLETISQKQVRSAAAVGLITMTGSGPLDYFNGGRALQRMWLAATEHGIAVHPMTALPYLVARAHQVNASDLDGETIARIQALKASYEQLFNVMLSSAGVFMFRMSVADATEKRSLRRPVEDVLQFQPSAAGGGF